MTSRDCHLTQHINDYEGGSGSSISFDCTPQVPRISFRRNSIPIPSCPPFQASLEELMEGGMASSLSVYDEAALCSSSFKLATKSFEGRKILCFLAKNFRILRGMVHTWLHEVSTNQNFYADLQLQHFYR